MGSSTIPSAREHMEKTVFEKMSNSPPPHPPHCTDLQAQHCQELLWCLHKYMDQANEQLRQQLIKHAEVEANYTKIVNHLSKVFIKAFGDRAYMEDEADLLNRVNTQIVEAIVMMEEAGLHIPEDIKARYTRGRLCSLFS